MAETQTVSQTITVVPVLDLPRTKSSSSDDSFTALMNAVLDSARSSGSLESSGGTSSSTSASTSTANSANDTIDTTASDSTASTSTTSTGTLNSVPSLAASGRTASSSSRSSSTSAPASGPASTSTSAASSTTPSPCPSILRLSSSNLTLPSRTGSPSITFAPLPQVEPRKRGSPHPLGVAARSRLLRHRRMLREQGLHPDDVPYPYGPGSGIGGGLGMADPDAGDGGPWVEDGPVEIREAQAGVDADEDARARSVGRGGQPRSRAMSDPSEGDALISLGRLVKGAGKTLWRSISMKDVRGKEGKASGSGSTSGAAGPESPAEGQEQRSPPSSMSSERRATLPRKTEVHLFDDPEARPPSADGGVWEEVVEEESWKKLLSQPPPPPPSAASTDSGKGETTPRASIEPVADVRLKKRTSTVEVFAARIR
ncbi:hypothetical protein GY45DRAFT_456623 [Cubamyces sp. BRFM 1775]|nr:hypothetical protein GY45DRAFT_456623 [Cubamyces sp. BRFM 1775]